MLKTLKQFICDTCGTVIEEPNQGYVEWETVINPDTGKKVTTNFHIVHNKNRCRQSDQYSSSLEYFTGVNGLSEHLVFLDDGHVIHPEEAETQIADIRKWTELVRRTQIPYYEEARQYFDIAERHGDFLGIGKVGIYAESTLKGIIEKYQSDI